MSDATSTGNLTLNIDVKNATALSNLGKVRQNLDQVKSKAKEAAKEAGELRRAFGGLGNEIGSMVGVGGLGRGIREISVGLASSNKLLKVAAVAQVGMLAVDIGKTFWNNFSESQKRALEEIKKKNEELSKQLKTDITATKGTKGLTQGQVAYLAEKTGGSFEEVSKIASEAIKANRKLSKPENLEKLRAVISQAIAANMTGYSREGDVSALAKLAGKADIKNIGDFVYSLAGRGADLSKSKLRKLALNAKGVTGELESFPEDIRERMQKQFGIFDEANTRESIQNRENRKKQKLEMEMYSEKARLVRMGAKYYNRPDVREKVGSDAGVKFGEVLLSEQKFNEMSNEDVMKMIPSSYLDVGEYNRLRKRFLSKVNAPLTAKPFLEKEQKQKEFEEMLAKEGADLGFSFMASNVASLIPYSLMSKGHDIVSKTPLVGEKLSDIYQWMTVPQKALNKIVPSGEGIPKTNYRFLTEEKVIPASEMTAKSMEMNVIATAKDIKDIPAFISAERQRLLSKPTSELEAAIKNSKGYSPEKLEARLKVARERYDTTVKNIEKGLISTEEKLKKASKIGVEEGEVVVGRVPPEYLEVVKSEQLGKITRNAIGTISGITSSVPPILSEMENTRKEETRKATELSQELEYIQSKKAIEMLMMAAKHIYSAADKINQTSENNTYIYKVK